MSEPFRSTPCPVCGAAKPIPVVASKPPAEALDFDTIKSGWMGFFKKKVFFSYGRCSQCGLLYAPVYLTDSALGELYGSMPDNTGGLSADYLQKTQKGYVDFLMEQKGISGDYFELGPDVGLLTQIIAGDPRIGKMWLYEPNTAVASILADRVKGKAFEIRTEMKDFSAVPDGSLGVCVLIHVLDHLPDVKAVMQALARKLRPGGYLLVVTHDERSLLARAFGSRWPAFCLQHPLLFNRKSTAMFLSGCGLQVIETRKSANYFPLTYLFKHLLYAAGLERIAGWKWNAFVVPLRLGNIMTVARRKEAPA